ncbi:hypothetical protein PPTG_18366 [Phytophthora nicotianae INRA-310]|uniref:Uncharacterized protein n=2 Tax=Phytophthora nicotianae TaxID=4792 RepID=W2PH60_PHYN3|nr:hypothetical protein PPTG_18366 [Phytophthora nicotianae INRA-310]ETM30626.1 hypothetical protein L914_21699 [Phytophthora nicotianae]ETM99980.1 hypothetical protein PPTG_18366 [Phytophthora nicotianae INRA-310]
MAQDPLLSVRCKRGVEALPHVVGTVSLFLDSSLLLPLEKASSLGSVALLNRIWRSLDVRKPILLRPARTEIYRWSSGFSNISPNVACACKW